MWGLITFNDFAVPSVAWQASGEGDGEQFIVVDGLSVTASVKFDNQALTTEHDETPGTLEVTCP